MIVPDLTGSFGLSVLQKFYDGIPFSKKAEKLPNYYTPTPM
jgi:hypothetical protein